MVRGRPAEVGDTRISANGYHYTRTKEGWRLTHHLLAEKALGRKLKEDERAYFKDHDRSNLDPDNILVKKVVDRKKQRIRQLEARIEEAKEELKELRNG